MRLALATHPRYFSAILEPSTASGCSPLRMGENSQERYATFGLVMVQLLLQEMVMPVFDEFISSELI